MILQYESIGQANQLCHAVEGIEDERVAKYRGSKRPGGRGRIRAGCRRAKSAKIRQARGGYEHWSIGQPNRLCDALVGVIDGYRAKFRGPKRPWGRETSRAVCRRAESDKIRQARGWVA